MEPYEEAKRRANEIAKLGFSDEMFTSISLGGEYVNSFDVEASMPQSVNTTKDQIIKIQKRLNELGAKPKLEEDGLMGRATLSAILTALKPVVKP